jgi:hypothetical protein
MYKYIRVGVFPRARVRTPAESPVRRAVLRCSHAPRRRAPERAQERQMPPRQSARRSAERRRPRRRAGER